MARMERERRNHMIVQSGDWQPPPKFKLTRGVLIARMDQGEYGLFYNGKWRVFKMVDWQSRFFTQIPAGLPTGWWAIMPKLEMRCTSVYIDNFTSEYLAEALNNGPLELASLPESKPMTRRGLNSGDRATVSV
jgi:hypothetical protein